MSLARVGDARSTGVLAPSLREGLEDLYRHELTSASSVRRGRLACAPHDNGVRWDCIGIARKCPEGGGSEQQCFVATIGVFASIQTYRKPSSVMPVSRSAKTSFGPSDVTLTISGTAHVTIEGHSGNTTATGAIDLTVGSCTDAQCPVQISRVELRLAIGINFRVDDETGSVTLRNDALLHGEVNGDGTGFHLAGSFRRDEVSAQFDLSGTPSSYRRSLASRQTAERSSAIRPTART